MDLRDIRGTQVTFSFDFVLALDWNEWPISAKEWITRPRKWQDQAVVTEVVNSGVYLVPKASKYGDPELEWRISFSKAEKMIHSCFPKPRGEYVFPGGRKITYDHLLIPDASCRIECYSKSTSQFPRFSVLIISRPSCFGRARNVMKISGKVPTQQSVFWASLTTYFIA